ncbi:MAG: hypothetical protein AB7M12_12795 [Hyphomonadaceae bacterium]
MKSSPLLKFPEGVQIPGLKAAGKSPFGLREWERPEEDMRTIAFLAAKRGMK